MKLRKREKRAIKRTGMITLLFIGIFIIVSLLTYEIPGPKKEQISHPLVSEQVLDYQPLVEKYAKQYNVDNYVDILLAMMMQESGGRGKDPMQASESYCGSIGCIDEPELSIKQGVYYFSKTLDKADGDVKLAIQSYNFGVGFIDFIAEGPGKYSEDAAIDFSKQMYQNAADKSIYRCLREASKEKEACYGDIYYVRSVMKYRDVISEETQ